MESLGAERQRIIRHLLETESWIVLKTENSGVPGSASRLSTLLAAEGCRNPSTGESWGVRTIARDLAAIEKQDAKNRIYAGITKACK